MRSKLPPDDVIGQGESSKNKRAFLHFTEILAAVLKLLSVGRVYGVLPGGHLDLHDGLNGTAIHECGP